MTANDVTWFEMNRTNSGTPAVTAYAGANPLYTHYCSTKEDLQKWMTQFPNAHNITVADTSKNIPKVPDYGGDDSLPLLIPFAKQYACGMKVQGKYRNKFPEGMIVHFTAGRGTAEGMLDYCVEKGYTLAAIDKDGTIVQSAPLDSWGCHCGTSHQETHIGIEIVNAGRLEKHEDGTFWSWFGTEIPKENVRYRVYGPEDEQISGYYEKYTPEQEEALIKLCKWLEKVGKGIFKYENVIGHDEACCRSPRGKGAKQDPGGSLSMTMPDFREMLKKG